MIPFLYTIIEPAFAIICVCLPTYRPLFLWAGSVIPFTRNLMSSTKRGNTTVDPRSRKSFDTSTPDSMRFPKLAPYKEIDDSAEAELDEKIAIVKTQVWAEQRESHMEVPKKARTMLALGSVARSVSPRRMIQALTPDDDADRRYEDKAMYSPV
jgi:hypothetical protein